MADAVTVADTATQILAVDKDRRKFALHNDTGANTVFIGYDSSVTTSTGIPLAGGETWKETETVEGAVYGIVASGTVDVRVQAQGIR